MFKDKLINEQKVAYITLLNSFTDKHYSHAYLISGQKGSYTKELAIYLAKSFLCDEDILACESCNTCRRVENNTYVDYKFIDGESKNILKEEIEDLQKDFSMMAIEPKGIKVYIIHLIENANTVAVNKLLKFLEEPSENIIGIITTNNISKVLPTIISRCQLIRVINPPKEDLINNIKELGYNDTDSFILSRFYNSIDEIKDIDIEEYKNIKNIAIETLNIMLNSDVDLIYYVENNVTNNIKDRSLIILYLEILQLLLRDLILNRKDNLVPDYIKNNNNYDLEDILSKLIINSGKLNLNINVPLILDKIFIDIIFRGEKNGK